MHYIRKVNYYSAYFLLLSMWLLYALNTSIVDRIVYEQIYFGIYPNHEIVFMLLCNFFRELGLSYQHFFTILATMNLLLLYKTLNFYSTNIFPVLALFFIYPFMGVVVTLRFSCALMLALYATTILAEQLNLTSMIKYCAFILLASMFHYSAIFYLVFLFARLKKYSIFVTILILLFSLLCGYSNLPTIIINSIFTFSPKVTNWFRFENKANLGVLVPIILHIISFIIFIIGYKVLNLKYKTDIFIKNCNTVKNIHMKQKHLDLIYNINILSFFLVILYIYNINFFSRTYSAILILNYTVFANVLSEKVIMKYKNMYICVQIVFCLFLSYFSYFLFYIHEIVFPIFLNNALLSLL